MSQKLVQELTNIATWYSHHRDQGMELPNRVEFLIKLNDMLVWTLATAAQDIANLEARRKTEDQFQGLFLPKGIKLHDGIRARN